MSDGEEKSILSRTVGYVQHEDEGEPYQTSISTVPQRTGPVTIRSHPDASIAQAMYPYEPRVDAKRTGKRVQAHIRSFSPGTQRYFQRDSSFLERNEPGLYQVAQKLERAGWKFQMMGIEKANTGLLETLLHPKNGKCRLFWTTTGKELEDLVESLSASLYARDTS